MNGLKKKRTVRKVATGEKGKIKKAEIRKSYFKTRQSLGKGDKRKYFKFF